MTDTVTYLIPEPFEDRLRRLRCVLSARHLNITGGLDISARLWQKLLLAATPCVVLFLSPRPALGAALAADRCVAAVAPFQIVVSIREGQTEVHVLRRLPGDCGSLKAPAFAALNHAHSEILRAIESMGMPAALGV